MCFYQWFIRQTVWSVWVGGFTRKLWFIGVWFSQFLLMCPISYIKKIKVYHSYVVEFVCIEHLKSFCHRFLLISKWSWDVGYFYTYLIKLWAIIGTSISLFINCLNYNCLNYNCLNYNYLLFWERKGYIALLNERRCISIQS